MQWTLHSNDKSLTTGYAGKKSSPAAMTAAIAIHIGAVAAFLLMPANQYIPRIDIGIKARPIPLPKDPPPQQAHHKKTQARPTQAPQAAVDRTTDTVQPPAGGAIFDTRPGGDIFGSEGTEIIDAHVPVLVDAQIDAARMRDFQPEYPASMERQQREGDVTVRVHINAQGRVDAVELVKATHDAFWKVTKAQALSRWRFRPATWDGEPVETTRTMTVHFRLSER